MYFKNFPKIFYNYKKVGLKVVTDITANVRPLSEILENSIYFSDYNIQSDETPEIIAERLYGDATLHWILLLVNESYDYTEDWPMPEWKLEEYITEKYGVGNEYDTHVLYGRLHYVTPSGKICDPTYPLSVPVTNDEYERSVNEAKRKIKIVQPGMIGVFVSNLQEAFPK